MGREAIVSRTFTTQKVTVMAVNLETAEVFNDTIVLPKVYAGDKLMKKVEAVYNNEQHKAVQIVDTATVETLYGMSEDEFIKSAKVLDPKTRKAVEQ